MVGHQAVGVANLTLALYNIAQHTQEVQAVLVDQVDVLARITACGDVVRGCPAGC